MVRNRGCNISWCDISGKTYCTLDVVEMRVRVLIVGKNEFEHIVSKNVYVVITH